MQSHPEDTSRVEELVALCMERMEAEGPQVVAEVCRQDPELEGRVRHLLDLMDGLGIDAGSGDQPSESLLAGYGMVQERLGPFRLLELLGRGGMGSVYLARDQDLGRRVALKVIRRDFLQDSKARSRFERETAALARLNHPGLCTIYRAGEVDGVPWISMPYVEGRTLEEILCERRGRGDTGRESDLSSAKPGLPAGMPSGLDSESGSDVGRGRRAHLTWCLELFERCARAIHSAHEVGLVHRDLKPGNIMVTPEGHPVVLDFGLARDDTSAQSITISGEQLGTPAYMSPEQVRGAHVDARSDQYSLAVTFVETLTGRLPHEGSTRDEVMRSIAMGRRSSSANLRRGYPRELSIVLDKAMDPDPDRRYRSLMEFADDLRSLREYRPIRARKIGPILRLRRWCQRNPVASTMLILLSLGIGASLVLLHRGNIALRHSHARGYANLAAAVMQTRPLHAVELALRSVDMERSPENLARLEETLQRAHRAEVLVPEGSTDGADFEVCKIRPSPSMVEDRFLLLTMATNLRPLDPILMTGDLCRRLVTPRGGAYEAHWTHDGERFLTTARGPIVRIWSKDGDQLGEIEVPGRGPMVRVAEARFLPDGKSLVASCNDGILRRYDLEAKRWTDSWESTLCQQAGSRETLPISALDLDSTGRFCVIGTMRQGAEIFDLESGRSVVFMPERGVRAEDASRVPATEVRISPDDRHVLVSWDDGALRLWTIDGRHLRTWGVDGGRASGAFSPKGDVLLTTHLDKRARIWSLQGDLVHRPVLESVLCGHQAWVVKGVFSRDGSQVLTCGADGLALGWNVATGSEAFRLTGSPSIVRAAAFDRNATACIVGGEGNQFRRFHIGRKGLPVLVGQTAGVRAIFELPEGWPGRLVTRGADSKLNFHDASGALVSSYQANEAGGSATLLGPRGEWLVYACWDQRVVMIDKQTLRRCEFLDNEGYLKLAFAGEDLLVAYESDAGSGQRISLFSRDEEKGWIRCPQDRVERFSRQFGPFVLLHYDPAHKLLLVARSGGPVGIFECEGNAFRHVRDLELPGELVISMAVSRDGNRLLFGCQDTWARVISIDGELLMRLPGHTGSVIIVDSSRDGSRLLTGDARSGVRIWDAEGHHLVTYKPMTGVLSHARFHSDGRRVLVSSTDGTTRFLWATTDRIIEEARAIGRVIRPEIWADYDRRAGR